MASWSDDRTDTCTILLSLNSAEVKSGDTVDEEGTLTLTIDDGE